MVKVILTKDKVKVKLTGWDKILALKRELNIPVSKIAKIYPCPNDITPPFFKFPGTRIPKVLVAGTYYGKGKKEFWCTKYKKNCLVFELRDWKYTRVVIDVFNISEVKEQLKVLPA